MKHLFQQFQLMMSALCLLSMLALFVSSNLHELSEEASSELVEFETDEVISERREEIQEAAQSQTVWLCQQKSISSRSRIVRRRACFRLDNERTSLNGMGGYLRI
ncbi:MAG: hypothetical protein AAFN77_07570 [Planctomycetota bacterium]